MTVALWKPKVDAIKNTNMATMHPRSMIIPLYTNGQSVNRNCSGLRYGDFVISRPHGLGRKCSNTVIRCPAHIGLKVPD
jgi:hypothetical protein